MKPIIRMRARSTEGPAAQKLPLRLAKTSLRREGGAVTVFCRHFCCRLMALCGLFVSRAEEAGGRRGPLVVGCRRHGFGPLQNAP